LTTGKNPSRLSVQISIRGKGINRLSHDALVDLVERAIDQRPYPESIDVRIMLWRAGKEIPFPYHSTEPRANALRELVRGLLHEGRIRLSVRSH